MNNNNSDDFIKGASGQAAKSTMDLINDGKNTAAAIRMVLSLCGIIAFVGNEAVKIIFRNNFGVKGLSTLRIILCFLSFIAVSIFSFSLMVVSKESDFIFIGSSDALFVTGILFIILAIFILTKGLKARNDAKTKRNFSSYEGDSILLSFLIKEGWSQSVVQIWAEPFATIAAAVIISFFNFPGAVALVSCALSVWIYQIIQFFFPTKPMRNDLSHSNDFSELKN